MNKTSSNKPCVYVVDGCRTPFLKARGKPGPFSAADLAVYSGRALLARQPFKPAAINEVVIGCTGPSIDELNIARIIALRLGCGKQIPAFTVQRNCASGMQALDSACKDILSGRHDLILAGGTDAMSRIPLLFNEKMVNWLATWMSARSVGARAQALTKLRLNFLAPVFAILHGLSDPLAGLSMGQTAENIAYHFKISRQQMDEFAVRSHQRVSQAQAEKLFSEIIPLYDNRGTVYESDDGVRHDSSVEKLSTLKPVFDKKFGKVTAGNSSQVTDGAALLLLASEEAVKKYNLSPLGRIVDAEWAGLDPAEMGLGPVYASTKLLERQKLSMNDIEYWEINEAFAAQAIGCLEAWKDEAFCREQLGLKSAYGTISDDRLNIDGGAVALGHPVGASGARIVLHLLHVLRRKNAHRGIASICIGGGQGGAMLIEV